MMLSEHFSLAEAIHSQTACRNGIDNTPPGNIIETMKVTAEGMEKIRALLGKSIIVSSWYRCPDLNKAAGGAVTSQHLKGEAVDFICPEFGTPLDVCKKVIDSGIRYDQIIFEFTWVHISFAENPRHQSLELVKGIGYRTLWFKRD